MPDYPKMPVIRLWSDVCLLDVYEEELAKPENAIIEHWEYKARLRTEILRRMRGPIVLSKRS